MRLAFVLFHYFPYGGLERDMLAMAQACKARGHEVVIYTQSWDGEKPDNIPVHELPVRALTNHGRAWAFVKKFQQLMQAQPADGVVGFNKMPGLDVYYAADVCFAQKVYEERHWLYRFSGRSRAYLALEDAVFSRDSRTQVLIISPAQIPAFQRYYPLDDQMRDQRLHLLPPGIKRDRIMPDDYAVQRLVLREALGITETTYLMLMVGSDFKRKGVARSIRALANLPDRLRQRAQLWVAGQDNPQACERLAQDLGVAAQVKILGPRTDIPQLMWSADVFLHPAHSEAAGAVLLEAMVAGLPVITTDVCGYAHFVAQQQMGRVLTADAADTALAAVITDIAAQDAQHWRVRAQHFAAQADVFSMVEHAVAIIEKTVAKSAVSSQ